MIRANFQDTLAPEIREIFFNQFEAEPELMPTIFNVKTSDRDQEIESAITGFGLMVQTSELGPLDYQDPNQMFKTTYIHLKYTLGVKIAEELVEDDQFNTIRDIPKAMAMAARRTREDRAASVFNNGFNTANTSYGDGKPLFSTSHTRADGGTAQSNASSTSVALNETNLNTIDIAQRKLLDDKGQKIALRPNQLLTPVDLDKTARILTDSQMRPETANNDINVYKGRFQVFSWEYISSTTAWFLLDSRNQKLTWFDRWTPRAKTDESFDSGALLLKIQQRFSFGWSDYRGVHGSQGDGASYSS